MAGRVGNVQTPLILISLVALAWRASRFAVVVADHIVQVRNLLTHRLPPQKITDTRTIGYSGWWHGIGTSRRIVTLVIVAGDRGVTAYGLLGRRITVGRDQEGIGVGRTWTPDRRSVGHPARRPCAYGPECHRMRGPTVRDRCTG